MKAWVKAQLDMTTYDKLRCPECPGLMLNADVQRAASKDVYARFDGMERRGIAEKNAGWRWCMNPECRAGQVHEPLLDGLANTPNKTDGEDAEPLPQRTNKDLRNSIVGARFSPLTSGSDNTDINDEEVAVVSPRGWQKVNKQAKVLASAITKAHKESSPTGEHELHSQTDDSPTRSRIVTLKLSAKGLQQFVPGSLFTCNTCGSQACVPCDRPFHTGETCVQYQRRKKRQTATEEKASDDFIEGQCKKCPKCKKSIEKSGGCDMMTCTQCHTSFCWHCAVDYRDVRTIGHGVGCAYAAPGAWDPHNLPANGIGLPLMPVNHIFGHAAVRGMFGAAAAFIGGRGGFAGGAGGNGGAA
ncbi:hypothetical protein LTR62_007479 [Meristemomyces frigidus]|uniref:RBR-type E3 ubiquitin transferase n=1 Tax=Meristemomyces frigidus TaxID=1508187 RepID=A0AAN7YHV7_9PEZI|nr:hypothetical protein LTR62_007479 [Meristemomyces frigidus]